MMGRGLEYSRAVRIGAWGMPLRRSAPCVRGTLCLATDRRIGIGSVVLTSRIGVHAHACCLQPVAQPSRSGLRACLPLSPLGAPPELKRLAELLTRARQEGSPMKERGLLVRLVRLGATVSVVDGPRHRWPVHVPPLLSLLVPSGHVVAVHLIPERFALPRLAPVRSAPVRFDELRLAFERETFRSVAWVKLAPLRLEPLRLSPERSR